MKVEGVTDGYEGCEWEEEIGGSAVRKVWISSYTADIQQGESEKFVVMYCRNLSSEPTFFETQAHQQQDEEKYKLQIDKNYSVSILVLDRDNNAKEWSFEVIQKEEGIHVGLPVEVD